MAGRQGDTMTKDPWQAEKERPKEESRRPDLGPVPRIARVALGILAGLKGLGLVLVAGAIAAGVAGVQSGDLDARYVLAMGAGGAILRALATWATSGLAQHMAATVKRDLRSKLWGRIAAGDAEGAERASDDDADKPTAPAR